jgi:hypothetical protein
MHCLEVLKNSLMSVWHTEVKGFDFSIQSWFLCEWLLTYSFPYRLELQKEWNIYIHTRGTCSFYTTLGTLLADGKKFLSGNQQIATSVMAKWCQWPKTVTAEKISSFLVSQYRIPVNRWHQVWHTCFEGRLGFHKIYSYCCCLVVGHLMKVHKAIVLQCSSGKGKRDTNIQTGTDFY